MFGIFRTTLALMVMCFHLYLPIAPLGAYAVFGFYVISGYLMTLIMHQSYGFTRSGRTAFAANRLLRLYPQYWGAAALSFTLIAVFGAEIVGGYHSQMYCPASLKEIFGNLLMFFPAWNPSTVEPRVVPPTWALTVELFFYALICIGISRSLIRVKVWFLLSVAYVVASFVLGMPSEDRYFPAAAASLPFSMGAGVYFLGKGGRKMRLRVPSGLLFAAVIVNCVAWMLLSSCNIGAWIEVGFYLNIALCFLLVWSIASGSEILGIDKSWDRRIGDLSYPIYLLHWQGGLLVSMVLFGEPIRGLSGRGFISLACTLFLVVGVALLFTHAIDKPLVRIRSRIKGGTMTQ